MATSKPGEVVPVRSRVVVQLDQAVDTDESRAGDRFTARLVAPRLGDARVVGRVIAASPGSEQQSPVLRLRIDRLERGRCRLPLAARITSAEIQERTPPESQSFRGGAIVGGVVGGLMWRQPGMMGGFGVGLTGGAIHDMRRGATQAQLREGALLTLQLDAPLDVRSCGVTREAKIR
jgi:hypothetical protein